MISIYAQCFLLVLSSILYITNRELVVKKAKTLSAGMVYFMYIITLVCLITVVLDQTFIKGVSWYNHVIFVIMLSKLTAVTASSFYTIAVKGIEALAEIKNGIVSKKEGTLREENVLAMKTLIVSIISIVMLDIVCKLYKGMMLS